MEFNQKEENMFVCPFMQTLSSVHAVSWPRPPLHQHHVPMVRDDEASEDIKFTS